jgi:hypothetical protein
MTSGNTISLRPVFTFWLWRDWSNTLLTHCQFQ